VSAYSVHYDIYNRRDPRDRRYRPQWLFLNKSRVELQNKLNHLARLVTLDESDPAIKAWMDSTTASLRALVINNDDATPVISKAANDFAQNYLSGKIAISPALRDAVDAAIKEWNSFADSRTGLIDKILKTPTVAIQYAVLKQGPVTNMMTGAVSTPGTVSNLPDLGTFSLIATAPIGSNGNLNFNGSFTNFNNTFKLARTRDYRLGLDFTAPMANTGALGKSSFSLSTLYLHLQNQPLGQDVTVNGQKIDSTGNVWFSQAKIEFPLGASGIKIPLALSYASREELLKNEKNQFGAHIGLTFDLDKLMSGKN
jgi:hypothetical protein